MQAPLSREPGIRFLSAQALIEGMTENHSDALATLCCDDFDAAIRQALRDSVREKHPFHWVRTEDIHEGFRPVLRVRAGLQKNIVHGSRFAAKLLMQIAETRESDALRNALHSIDGDRLLANFCEASLLSNDEFCHRMKPLVGRYPGFFEGGFLGVVVLERGSDETQGMADGFLFFMTALLNLLDEDDF